MKRLILFMWVAFACFGQATANTPFIDFFDPATGPGQWTITSGSTDAARWWTGAEIPGAHIQSENSGMFIAPWAIGNGPFYIRVSLPVNNVEGIANNPTMGMAVALTTGVPGSMSSSDSSIVGAMLLNPGPYMGWRTGELALFGGTDLSAVNLGGGWPQASAGSIPSNWVWSFEFSRDVSNNLTLTLLVDRGLGTGFSVYSSTTWAIPAGQQAKSFQHVVFLNLLTSASTNFQSNVQVTNVHGYTTITGGSAHTVTSIIPSRGSTTFQSGSTITITGTGFDCSSPYSLRVGQGSTLQTVTPTCVNSTTQTAVLPTETNGITYSAWLFRNNIYAEIPGGIVYGVPTLYSITPHEVPLTPVNSADGTVQVHACGVDTTSTMSFGGNAATVTYIDPCDLAVVVPAGTLGLPRIILTANSGGTLIYDSNTSGTYPPSGRVNFGYAAHPYMNFTDTGTAGVPTRASVQSQWTAPAMANYVAALKNNLVGTMTTDPICSPTPCWSLPAGTPGSGSFLDYGWAYVLSGDASYLSPYKTALAASFSGGGSSGTPLIPSTPILNSIFFSLGGFDFGLSWAQQIAVFYDALFPSMTPAERANHLAYLDTALGYFKYVSDTFGQSCGNSNTSNRQSICASGGGAVALAEVNSLATVQGHTSAAPWIAISGQALVTKSKAILTSAGNNYMFSWTPDGGNVEGSQYSGFGGIAYLSFAHEVFNTYTLLGISPADQGLFSANIELLNSWVNSLWDGSIWATYDDTEPQWYDAALMAEVGSRQAIPQLLYLADYLVQQGLSEMYTNHLGFQTLRYDYLPYAYLWRGTSAGTFSSWPTVQVNASVDQAALRSTSNFNTELYVGVKGKSQQELIGGGHTHPDQGSFVCQSRGEEFCFDPGYNVAQVTNHSIVKVDGVTPAQGSGNTASFDGTVTLNNTHFRSVALDVTPAYASGVTKLRRTFTLYNNGTNRLMILLDDTQPTGVGAVVDYFQTAVSTAANAGVGFTMTGVGSKMTVKHDGPARSIASASASLGCGGFTPSWVNCELGVNYNTVQTSYTASTSNPLITTFAPGDLSGANTMTATFDRSVSNQVTAAFSDGGGLVYSLVGGIWIVTATNDPPASLGSKMTGTINATGQIRIQQ